MKLTNHRFLWVSMQIESLCDSRRVKLQGDLVDALARLPRSLAGMYTLILENIGQIDQRGRTVAETIFRWLLCTKDARSSVTIAACSRAISIESRNLSIPDILDVCSTLVVYDESLDRFRFAHLSAREFFESQPGYTPSEANRSILETSLQIVICHQPYEGRFWLYATAYWIFHYHKLEEQHRKEVFEFHAKCFFFSGAECSDVFKKWAIGAIEAHALNGDWLDPELLYSPFQEFGIRTHHLDTFDEVFRSPVDLASCSGWLEILDHFKTNQSPDDFYGPATKIMRMAIHFGQTSVVRWLFDQNVCPTDEHFEIAFHLGRPEIVQTFLDMNVLSLNTLVKGHEILVLAVCSGPRDIPWDLIKKRASTRYQDQNGRTLLFHAVSTSSNNSESIEDLLLTGIDPTAKDEAGKTPLSLSIWGGRQLRSYLLLKKRHLFKSSTFEHAKNIQQHVLQLSDDHTACLLLHYGLDTMLDDADICAEWMEILTLIGTLPGLQSDVSTSVIKRTGKLADDSENEIQVAGQTLLSLAAFFRHDKAFRVLLGWGIDPTCPAICNVRKTTSTVAQTGRSMKRQEPVDQKRESQKNKMSDELRQGPLAWATYTGNLPVVQSILDRGLNPNIKNRKGQTALYCAVQKTEDKYLRKDLETDKEAIVRLLLQKGAFVTSADTYGGATLLAHGFKARYSNIAKLLLENGAGIPKGATDGPMELLWGAFDQGQEGLRQNLLERIRGAQDDSLDLQPSSSVFGWSGEPIGIAARLIWAGTMRVLGDMVLTASGDVNSSTRWGSV